MSDLVVGVALVYLFAVVGVAVYGALRVLLDELYRKEAER